MDLKTFWKNGKRRPHASTAPAITPSAYTSPSNRHQSAHASPSCATYGTGLRYLLRSPSTNEWLADQNRMVYQSFYTKEPHLALRFVDHTEACKRARAIQHLVPDVTVEARRL